jgi:hypothetical protein
VIARIRHFIPMEGLKMKYPVMFGTLTAAFTVGMVSALAEDHFRPRLRSSISS